MDPTDDELVTPIYIKTTPDSPVAVEEPVAYLLTSTGLFLCRNHRFFRSCVPAPSWPTELAAHQPSLELEYPPIPREQFERLVGFFARVGERHGAEAAALVLWDAKTERITLHIPEQVASVSKTWSGRLQPIDLHYEIPLNLAPELSVIGDIHSHVDEPAYASHTDKQDEQHSPGVHLVVGKISREPPQFHAECVVDGFRFVIKSQAVVEAYESRRDDVPAEWFDRLKVETLEPYSGQWSPSDSYGNDTYSRRPATGLTYQSRLSRARHVPQSQASRDHGDERNEASEVPTNGSRQTHEAGGDEPPE